MKTPTIKPPKLKIADEFRQFILRGNVIDMAVGIIIGAAFGKIVSSLVGDVLMPPIGVLIGGVDFTSFKIQIAADSFIEYGKFLQTTFDFVITAFAIFLVIKLSNKLRRAHEDKTPEAPKPVEVSKEEQLLTEIRDLLKSNNNQLNKQ